MQHLTGETIEKGLESGAFESVQFSMGCFWKPDAVFGGMSGVIQTRVGYAGALTPSPHYHQLGGHAETLRVVYLPGAASFKSLLNRYATLHTPFRETGQYRSIIFVATDAERDAADAYAASLDVKPTIVSRHGAAGRFWSAEDKHQKYRLRRKKALIPELEGLYGPRWDETTVATKLNARGTPGFELGPWVAGLPEPLRPLIQ